MNESTVSYPGLFQRLRAQLFRNHLRALMERSVARMLTIFFCSAVVWCFLFFLSWQGFHEWTSRFHFRLNIRIFEVLYEIMFFALAVLLVFSTGIILYSSLFAAAESWFLLSTPVPAEYVFRYKFVGAVAFSSWAFLLLGSPILLAYGIEIGAPWHYYALLPLFFLGFVLMPGCIGAMLVLFLVNFLPSRKSQVMWLAAIIILALAIVYIYSTMAGAAGFRTGSRAWFESILSELSTLGKRLGPIQWIARGFMTAAAGEWADSLYYLLLIWSQGLVLWLVTVWLARKWYRRGFNRVATGGDLRRRYGGGWLDNLLSRLLFFIDPQTRLLLVKDFRTFRRDPAQWIQIVLFLGLVSLYFGNLRRFYEQELPVAFQNFISLLTILATGFLTCAYTGRFIYPMLSLEGRKFWILGLLPLDRGQLLWGKFAFSAVWCAITSLFVVVLSDWMLNMPWLVLFVHMATALMMSLGLSGLSVGLGACLPNFRETDPSKIAVGFGGTLNLVAGLMFLIGLVLLMAGPFHLVLMTRPDLLESPLTVPWWTWALAALGFSLGAAAIWLPMQAGARSLRKMEF